MPNAVVKKYAKETGLSPEHIEKWWKDAEKQALKKFPNKGPRYWAYVNGIVERRGKLVHGKRKGKKTNEGIEIASPKMTFKEYLDEAKKSSTPNYEEVEWKMDKYLPEDPDLQTWYHELMDNKDEAGLVEFFRDNADYQKMMSYAGKGFTLEGFAKWLIDEKA